jgi:hypothetical protein
VKYAKFEEVTPVRWEPMTDTETVLAALIEQSRVQSEMIVRLIWGMGIIGVVVFVPIVNHYLLPLLRG